MGGYRKPVEAPVKGAVSHRKRGRKTGQGALIHGGGSFPTTMRKKKEDLFRNKKVPVPG